MDYQERDGIPAELEHVAARLREQRTTPTAMELDRMKLRILERAGQPRPGLISRKKETWMKSRFALTLVIATGLLMGTGGATMAVTGNSGSGSAADKQYSPANVAGDKSGGDDAVLGSSSGGDVADPSEQVATASSSPDSLPFSGFAAIPLLVLGTVLLIGGTALRVKLARDQG